MVDDENAVSSSDTITISDEMKLKNRKKRIKTMSILVVLIILIALLVGAIWWIFYRNYESTDDSYVGGNIVVVSARQEGSVVGYRSDDTDYVEQGELLVQLDPADYLALFEKQKAKLALATRQVLKLYEDVQQKKANVLVEESKYSKAKLDLENRNGLVETEAISLEDYQHIQSDYDVAKASVELAKHELEAAQASLGTTSLLDHPTIEEAKVDFIIAYIALQRTKVYAPVSGFIAKRNVQLGQSVKAGVPLMNIVPLDNLWVDANFKETQVRDVRIGQPVKLTSDMYGKDVVFHGKVAGFIPGSGSVFSLLPPQNTTGNWIKIVQRVPVRIYLDPEEVKKHTLFLGLSFYTTIDISDKSGVAIMSKPIQISAKTNVFDINLEPAYELINKIVESNLQFESTDEITNE